MKRSVGTLVLVGLLLGFGSAAHAGVTRYTQGNFVTSNAYYKRADGSVLQHQAPKLSSLYATARGYYGGGDTASGRLTAKNRATNTAKACLDAFWRYGVPTDRYKASCLISDITVAEAAKAHSYFQYFLTEEMCRATPSLRASHNYVGPIYVTAELRFFSDNAGSEADYEVFWGNVSTVCY